MIDTLPSMSPAPAVGAAAAASSEFTLPPGDRLMPMPEVVKTTGMSRSFVFVAMRRGTFPKPIRIGSASRFLESEIRRWMAARVAESRGEKGAA